MVKCFGKSSRIEVSKDTWTQELTYNMTEISQWCFSPELKQEYSTSLLTIRINTAEDHDETKAKYQLTLFKQVK